MKTEFLVDLEVVFSLFSKVRRSHTRDGTGRDGTRLMLHGHLGKTRFRLFCGSCTLFTVGTSFSVFAGSWDRHRKRLRIWILTV